MIDGRWSWKRLLTWWAGLEAGEQVELEDDGESVEDVDVL